MKEVQRIIGKVGEYDNEIKEFLEFVYGNVWRCIKP